MPSLRATYDVYDYEKEKRHAFEALAALVERIVHHAQRQRCADPGGEQRVLTEVVLRALARRTSQGRRERIFHHPTRSPRPMPDCLVICPW